MAERREKFSQPRNRYLKDREETVPVSGTGMT
jgi:hypothetical protein